MVEEKDEGQGGSGHRVRVAQLREVGSGVVSARHARVEEREGNGVVTEVVVGSGIEAGVGRGIGRKGNRGRQL